MTDEERKAAMKASARKYYLANREKVLARTAKRKHDKAALVKEENRRWYEANRETKLAQNAAWTAANLEHHRALNRGWGERNPERRLEIKRAYNAANPEKLREQGRALYAADPEKGRQQKRAIYAADPARAIARSIRWRKANRAIVAFWGSMRRAAELQATPRWLTAEQKAEIKAIYILAREKGLHVDHIVPLRGKTVCGLHVAWNLQPLTRQENSRKHNKLLLGSHVIPPAYEALDAQ